MNRVIAIGLDAAEWWLVEDLMARGRLPNLSMLHAQGITAQLENVREYRSELPWTLFWTGRPAHQNRYWSTIHFDPETYGVHEVGAHSGPPFWRDLPSGRVVTFDVPHVPIFWERDDLQVTAWGAHSPQYERASQPRGLLRAIDEAYGPHPALERDHEPVWFDSGLLETLHGALVLGAERRTAIVEQLARRPGWELLITVMSEPHSIGHHAWHGVDDTHPAHEAPTAEQAGRHVRSVYEAMDRAIGRMRAAAPDATCVVFAAHGMQANTNELTSLLMLPELAHRARFGTPSMAASPPWWDRRSLRLPAPHHSWGMDVVRLRAEARGERFRRALRLATPTAVFSAKHAAAQRLGRAVPGRLPFAVGEIAGESDLSPEAMAQRRVSCSWQPPCWWQGRWPEMAWFALPTYSDGHLRINLEGRERDGMVAKHEYGRACDEVAATLRALRNPRTGREAVEDVAFVRAEDPYDPDGPTADVVVLWKEPVDVVTHPELGRIGPLPFRRTGEHSSNGFVIAAGPGVHAGDLGRRRAADLAPTLLALLGRDIPADVDGHALLAAAPATAAG